MSLYLDHFGLRESPYRITPHTEFFFDGANRGATLDALIYAIVHDEGIVKVTGEVGSGKTMLCRMLLERLPATVETIYFANPSVNRDELLLALADELKLPTPPAQSHQLLRAFQQQLVTLHEAGKQVVVLIDEAHAMPEESLEEIRLLSNLETQRSKLLQIVLFGQPELNDILGTQEMRQLRERVTHNFYLEPFKQPDVSSYLMFRLRAAGYHGPDVFAPAAIKRFAEVSHGLTRRLNILADKALLAAFAANTHLIDLAIANVAVADAHFDDTGVARQPTSKKPWLGAGIAAGAAALLVAGWLIGTKINNNQTKAVAPLLSAASPTQVEKQILTPSQSANSGKAVDSARPQVGQSIVRENSLLVECRARFNTWIQGANGRNYSIQLLRIQANHSEAVEAFLRRAAVSVDPSALYVYDGKAGDQRWTGVLYGEFELPAEAEAALASLPPTLRTNQPFVRPLRQLKP